MLGWIDFVQIAIIVLMVWFFYKKFVENSSSEKLVHGLLGLAILWVVSFVMEWLKLDLFAVFLHWVALFLSVGLVVVFQPELRKLLVFMGNVRTLKSIFTFKTKKQSKDKNEKIAQEIIGAIKHMSEKNTGALMVFQGKIDDGVIEKIGTIIDGEITNELIVTIFQNKTPLHDGAVIIRDSRIYSAGAILPLSSNGRLNWKYGTRHRAAIGISEASKVSVLVVSEESGDISIANNGSIKKYNNFDKLKVEILKILKA